MIEVEDLVVPGRLYASTISPGRYEVVTLGINDGGEGRGKNYPHIMKYIDRCPGWTSLLPRPYGWGDFARVMQWFDLPEFKEYEPE